MQIKTDVIFAASCNCTFSSVSIYVHEILSNFTKKQQTNYKRNNENLHLHNFAIHLSYLLITFSGVRDYIVSVELWNYPDLRKFIYCV